MTVLQSAVKVWRRIVLWNGKRFVRQRGRQPLATNEQTVTFDKETKNPWVAEMKAGVTVQAALLLSGDFFGLVLTVWNGAEQPVPLRQERVFLLDCYSRRLFRFSGEAPEEYPFRNVDLQPGYGVRYHLGFKASNAARRHPVTLLVRLGEIEFRFEFQERARGEGL